MIGKEKDEGGGGREAAGPEKKALKLFGILSFFSSHSRVVTVRESSREREMRELLLPLFPRAASLKKPVSTFLLILQ